MSNTLRLRSLLVMGASAAALATAASPALAQDAPTATASRGNVIEELVVTAQRREEGLQDVPVAVSAFSQETLKAQRLDGGGNLVLSVPNVNFSRGNFGGYNFSIRGIGSKVVGAGGTSGVSFHENNSPLSSNRLADAEFYDVERVEVLRGPQGTLYGRNASGGVINVITAKPVLGDFGGSLTGEYGKYNSVRGKGSINIPIGQTAALRVAGFYLNRDGFGDNIVTGNDIDDRDITSVRTTLSFEPTDSIRTYVMWEHFNEKDSRSRVGKQLCIPDPGRAVINGINLAASNAGATSQGCLSGSLYQDAAYGAVNSTGTLAGVFGALTGLTGSPTDPGDVNRGKMQGHNLYDIDSTVDPVYEGRQDFVQASIALDLGEYFTATSLTSYNRSHGYSIEDYNRITAVRPFNTTPNPINAFAATPAAAIYPTVYQSLFPNGYVSDPQLGTSNYLATYDRGVADSKEWTQELRLESHFDGPLNFSLGGIYIDYRNLGSDYYVQSNALTAFAQVNNALGGALVGGPIFVDPNADPDRSGHNYYDSHSISHLRSRAVFGEVYYQLTDSLKATGGLRVTRDTLRATNYGILLAAEGKGFGEGIVQRDVTTATTGRLNLEWTPTLSFTNHTLLYASYSRGYKGGGFNTPCDATSVTCASSSSFDPEYINAYEIGAKNTLLDGSLVLNATGFYYDYKGYQISQIVNKSSTNVNVDAKIYGAELESIWEPVRNLRFNANVGYLHTELRDVDSIDLYDRTAGNPNLVVVKDTGGANCVLNTAGLNAAILQTPLSLITSACQGKLGVTGAGVYDYSAFPGMQTAPVHVAGSGGAPERTVLVGQGVALDLSGNRLPNSPEWTLSLGAQYRWDIADWQITLRGDYYRQAKSYSRIYNSAPDLLKSWENVNATLTFNNEDWGANVQFYVKNAFDKHPLTDTYLTDDSSGLFSNVFTLDPREYGVSLTKTF